MRAEGRPPTTAVRGSAEKQVRGQQGIQGRYQQEQLKKQRKIKLLVDLYV